MDLHCKGETNKMNVPFLLSNGEYMCQASLKMIPALCKIIFNYFPLILHALSIAIPQAIAILCAVALYQLLMFGLYVWRFGIS